MKNKHSWILIIFISLIVSLFCDYRLINKLNFYFKLNSSMIANIKNSYITKNKNEKYIVVFEYTFNVEDKVFFNKKSFDYPFLNIFTAKEFKDKILKSNLKIWYNKKDPNLSSLNKNFPVKNFLYSAITTIIFFYFIFLKYYLSKFYNSK